MAAVDQVLFRTGIAAVNQGDRLRVYSQDVQGNIRESKFEGSWSQGNNGNVIAQGKIGSPIAACSDLLNEIRVYYISADNKLREHCYSADKGWYPGGLNDSNIVVAPYSKVAACFLAEGVRKLRVYCQGPDNTIQEYGINDSAGWHKETNLGAALPGTEIATTSYKTSVLSIRTYFQDTSLNLIEKAYDANKPWYFGRFSVTNALPRTCLAVCCFAVTNTSVNLRVYYGGANNRLLEKGHDGGDWYDGGFNQPSIPGTDAAVIFWGKDSGMNLRVYFQNGTQTSGVSEWLWNGKWSQGVKAIPPA